VTAALADFERVALEDPVNQAAVRVRTALLRRRLSDELRANLESRFSGEPPRYAQPPTDFDAAAIVQRLVERVGAERAQDEVADWWRAREEASDPSK
jgi:hypothetical protein